MTTILNQETGQNWTAIHGDSAPNEFYVYGIKPQQVTNQSVTFEWSAKGRWKD